jgi:uncharacterized protein YbjT (DUF2867 family)
MILVTGGTGGIGSELLRLLSQAGVGARALTRNPYKAQKLSGITWIPGDLARPETLTTAFDGAKSLFLLTSYYEDMVELQHNAITAARAAGVTHVVKVSAFAASDHSKAPIGRWHYQVEKELQASGMGWTILRPHHFMQNLLAQAEYIRKDGVVYSASGDGKIPYIDLRDIAAVAFVTLTVHAEDCAACETPNARLTVIDREIALEGPLDEDQRSRLLAMANRCPVHRTLSSRIDIRTTLQSSYVEQTSPRA